ncbi:MAG: N-acetyltransferase family protein [Actinomycetota bacterium]
MTVDIRAARPEDLDQLVGLFDELDRYQSAWRVFEPRPTLRDETARRYRSISDDPDSIQVVAEDDGRVVAMAVGRVSHVSSISDERVLDVSNVVVLPSHRRRGIARSLILALAAFARERGARRLALKTYAANREAMRFWESLGFTPRYVQMTSTVEELGGADG